MKTVYLIKNQEQLYYAKDGTWLSYKQARKLYFNEHRDEALNTLIEANSKHTELRLSIEQAQLNEKTPVLTNETE